MTNESNEVYEVVENKPKILCCISTKDRYDILPIAIQSVISQTVPPTRLILCDDGAHKDLREIDVYAHMFKLLNLKGIEWEVYFSGNKGQHHNHHMANKMDYDYVWRLDDDEFAEHDVIERLLPYMKDGVGGVGGAVITPGSESRGGTNKIEDIFHTPNLQWGRNQGVHEVDHLYSSFLYRAGVADYNLELSPVAHREETLFSMEMSRKGYKLIVDTSIVTYHYRQSKGGIRAHDNKWYYIHDDGVFLKKLESWGYKVCRLDAGLGDHLAFAAEALPKLIEKYDHVIVGACYPDVFKGYKVKVIPVGVLSGVMPDENVYRYMVDNKYGDGNKGNLVQAYKKMYGV